MKLTLFARSIILIIALLFVMGSITPAYSEPEARVFVEYRVGQKAAVQNTLKNAGAAVHYQFDELNSFVVSLPESALNGIRRNPNVVSIEEDPIRELVRNMPSEAAAVTAESILPEQIVPYGVDMVQARDIWDANYDLKVDKKAPTGAGRTVCIIDTGFYTEHEDFVGVEVLGGYSQTNDDPALWTYDGYGHGTHVAGTIVAQNNDYGVVGVTPGTTSLYIVKIFGDDGLWVTKTHASDLVAAAYMCYENGANIISMSLSGTTKNFKEQRAFDDLYYNKGVLSVAAASNDGVADYHYPASYDSVISVGALDKNMLIADFSNFNDQVELAAPGVGVLSTVPFINISSVTVGGETYSGYPVEFAALGIVSGDLVNGELCTSTGDWSGKVVLCERGEISFYDKVMNVQNSGGVAAVLYNNIDEDLFATLGEGNTSTIPAIGLSQDLGIALLDYLDYFAEVENSSTPQASGYEAWAGTSMATPHVSAVAALIWSWDPSLTNVKIREAMAATALDLGETGRDDYYGYGLVQAFDAWVSLGGGKPGKK